MAEIPPSTCTGTEEVFEDIEIFDAQGNYQNIIVASECYASYYCEHIAPGFTWRHKPPEPPAPETPADDTDPEP